MWRSSSRREWMSVSIWMRPWSVGGGGGGGDDGGGGWRGSGGATDDGRPGSVGVAGAVGVPADGMRRVDAGKED